MISVVNSLNILLLVSSLLLGGCFRSEAPETLIEMKGEVFGSYYLVKYRGDLKQEIYQKDLDIFFKGFNDEFSTYQKDSVISTFNSSSKNSPMKVSKRFIEMLKLSEKFYRETEGAFDPTLGPVIRAWGFGGGKEKKVPSPEVLKEAKAHTGFDAIKWDEKKLEVWKTKDGIFLDVNAFAPGWAADLMGKLLEQHGIHNYMVDISGEIVFKGQKTSKQEWIAGIEKPAQKYAEGVHLAFKMPAGAIATSGDYRQFFDENGERRSHIIDGRTGQPVNHRISSASVIGNSGASADAWSTALMVLGPEGIPLAEKNGIKVLLLRALEKDKFEEVISPSMHRFIEAHKL